MKLFKHFISNEKIWKWNIEIHEIDSHVLIVYIGENHVLLFTSRKPKRERTRCLQSAFAFSLDIK
jgi:hypothetical protein